MQIHHAPLVSSKIARDAQKETLRYGAAKHWIVVFLVLAALAAIPPIAQVFGMEYYTGLLRRILAMVVAAIGLNFLVGYCGLTVIGFAGFIGLGAYSMAALSEIGISSTWLAWLLAALMTGAVGIVIGAISLRTSGVYFLMITLAFAQMLYYLAVSARHFGGEDGHTLYATIQFGFGLDGSNPSVLYWVFLGIAACTLLLMSIVVNSRFGKAMVGIRDNENRMQAMGYPVYALKLAAFSGAAAVGGLSGAMLATNADFVSPAMLHSMHSLLLLVMVALGGFGRLWGAPVGVTVWMLTQDLIQAYAEYWRLPLGIGLVIAVFVMPQGLTSLSRRHRKEHK